MSTISFGSIDQLLVFGGGRLVAHLVPRLSEHRLPVRLFSSPRHLEEQAGEDGATLASVLDRCGVPYLAVEDINADERVRPYLVMSAFGLAIGPAWIFRAPVLDRLRPRLVNFHGIRLPQYRGGAHYSWQILRRNRVGACNIQLVDAVLDAGEVIKTRQYFFPADARIPQDYFDAAIREELAFLDEFLSEVRDGREFPLARIDETMATFFPRLNTMKQGFIDWSWDTADIEVFIAAFDAPYAGASTFVDGGRVFLKNCSAEYGDGPFHPFQAGLIYRRLPEAAFVATRQGAIVVRKAVDEAGNDIMASLKVGHRLHTPRAVLEEAMTYRAVYDAKGVKA